MDDSFEYYTLKGYELNNSADITSSMEDYLEMICRMLKKQDVVRVNELAERLHVKPSSASKMVSNLRCMELVYCEKYGYIKPTTKGLEVGEYLLYRHDVLSQLLCLINNSNDETEQVEKIEHFLNEKTVRNIEKYIKNSNNSIKSF